MLNNNEKGLVVSREFCTTLINRQNQNDYKLLERDLFVSHSYSSTVSSADKPAYKYLNHVYCRN